MAQRFPRRAPAARVARVAAMLCALAALAACGPGPVAPPVPTGTGSGPSPAQRLAPPPGAAGGPPLSATPELAALAYPVPSPGSLACALRRLNRSPVIAEPAPYARGWRLKLRLYTTPPTGWLDKGDILHDGARLSYLPNGATRGLDDEVVESVVEPILEECL